MASGKKPCARRDVLRSCPQSGDRAAAAGCPRALKPRVRSADQVRQIAASIRVSGFTGPVLFAGGNTIIAGARPCADGAGDGHGCCAVPFGLPVRVPGQPERNWTRARQPAQ